MAISSVCSRSLPALTVLFVDDDADTRFAYQLVATEGGMIVELASDGDEAIALAGAVLPDVIVLDVGLGGRPGPNGLEVARRLRASERTNAIPIVFLTGYGAKEDVAAMRATGCDGYLAKPCSAETLLGLIKDVAAGRRSSPSGEDARAAMM
jgi:CheY-like chemotaxis protein